MDCSSTRRRRPVRMALAELPLVANLNVASRSSNNGESVRDQRWPLYVDPSRPLCTNSNHRLSDNARAMKSRRQVARIPEVDCPRLAMKFESSSGNRVCLGKATTTASSSADRTVDLGSFGPVGTSATEVRPFHLATVF